MKIYIVVGNSAFQHDIRKVFTDKEVAEMYLDMLRFQYAGTYTIKEMETADEEILKETKRAKFAYTYEVVGDGTLKERPIVRYLDADFARVLAACCGDSYYNGQAYYAPVDEWRSPIWTVVVYRNQRDKADKIAHELWNRFKRDMKEKGVTLKYDWQHERVMPIINGQKPSLRPVVNGEKPSYRPIGTTAAVGATASVDSLVGILDRYEKAKGK